VGSSPSGSDGSDQVIPFDRLPRGFAERLDRPEAPADPRPAATVVVLREGEGGQGVEVLLLRRVRSAGFVPGAYVFPGGRVDPEDGAPEVVDRLTDRDAAAWARRLGVDSTEEGHSGAAYLVAALRETFEETGILVARNGSGGFAPSADRDPAVAELRSRLLGGEIGFARVLEALDVTLDDGQAEYIAHWITPEAEPRRYDTRFFAVRVPRGVAVTPWEKEITDHRWLTPARALELREDGELPMVFPTIRTLEDLTPFSRARDVLQHFGRMQIPTILPRLVRTPTGVGIEVPGDP
jgi:8-oxo-dGTP pyrophosphatase MutT (NUDIX family)